MIDNQTYSAKDLTREEFRLYQDYLLGNLGIRLADSKVALVRGRLHSRIRKLGLDSYGEYLKFATASENRDEYSIMIDKLTTHETRFFREMAQYKWLLSFTTERKKTGERPFRVWSAACSSGEEVYSIAMVLSTTIGADGWEVHGSDVSQISVNKAATAVYENRREREIPEEYLKQFCLRGVDSMAGYFAVKPELKKRTTFKQMNLVDPGNSQDLFDVVFMNNVMIYFDQKARVQVIKMVRERLRQGGYLIVGASESINGIAEGFEWVQQSIYRKK